MNDLYAHAKRRLVEIAKEELTLREFIRVYERTERLLGGGARAAQGSLFTDVSPSPNPADTPPAVLAAAEAPPETSTPAKKQRVTDNPKPAVVVEAAIQILRENKAPMSRREIHAALASRGLEVKGADPVKALGTMLWRGNDKLVQLDGHGYWPKEDVYLPAGYYGDLA